MATTAATLASWLELGAEAETEPRATWLADIAAAVVETIEERCIVPDAGWSARQELAGKLLGARLYTRRLQPQGNGGFDPVALASMHAGDVDLADLLAGSERLTGFA